MPVARDAAGRGQGRGDDPPALERDPALLGIRGGLLIRRSEGEHVGRADIEGPAGPGQGRSPGDGDQTGADADQTRADTDQTLADTDQTLADADQTSSDRDQDAADQDQAAADRDLASGVDAGAHDISRGIREHSARQRELSTRSRGEAASHRDVVAEARDVAAAARDLAAQARDLAMDRRDEAEFRQLEGLAGPDLAAGAADQRHRAARQGQWAAEQRALAAEERLRAAADREQAARDRRHAREDRELLARQIAISEVDPLTGARSRAAGLRALEDAMARCERTDEPLSAVYLDVIGLKALNDSEGHAAGDELLKRVVALIGAHLRPYDLVIRLGGDEFLCVMNDTTLAYARSRFAAIADELAAAAGPGAIRTGFALLRAGESAAALVARADRQLVESKRAASNGGGR
ncbi:MAG: hypothetical protein QOD86_2761 [Miltoncostaeaceae bacterium]|nr:hypothetical protein [Miltoncostaeaceae bacterium]